MFYLIRPIPSQSAAKHQRHRAIHIQQEEQTQLVTEVRTEKRYIIKATQASMFECRKPIDMKP
jgi:hypothetical protein